MAYHGNTKITRDTREGKLGGVCAGLSDYLKVDVTILRIIAGVSILLYGTGLAIYVLLWILLPERQY